MSLDDFKIGDKVVCINPFSNSNKNRLTLNKEYIIVDIDRIGYKAIVVVGDGGKLCRCFKSRFVTKTYFRNSIIDIILN